MKIKAIATPPGKTRGGFNTHLLTELRNAMLSVEDGGKPAGPVQAVVAEWIKRLPSFDFPDDEIG